jgi:ABC-type Fe3+-hydroxamate transport system substrate-binding protein
LALWVTFPKTVSDAINLLWNMMQLFDETSMVPRVRLIEQTLDWVLGVSQAAAERAPRVFVPLGLEPLVSGNGDTYMHDLLRVCGATNVAADFAERYPHLDLDAVEAAQPDVILLPDNVFQDTEAQIPLFTQLDVPAAQHDRVFLVDGTLLTWPGTRLAYALDKIPALLEV